MSSDNVNICLGIDRDTFWFNPAKVHDLYAQDNVLYIELTVDNSFIATYEFQYSDIDDLLVDFRAIASKIPSKEASHVVADMLM